METKSIFRPERVATIVRVAEGLICAGTLAMWAGLLKYHIQNREIKVPSGLPDNKPVRAILRMTPSIDDASFYMIVIGAALAGFVGFLALAFIKSKHKSKYIGMYGSFALTATAWHLFRTEGRDTLDNYTDPKTRAGVDLWAPITSNLVLLFMSMLLMQHNLFTIPLFEKLPSTQGLVCRLSVMAGAVFAQFYFIIMILVNYILGIVLLASSIFLILFGYIGGQVWEYLMIQTNRGGEEEEKAPLTEDQI
jgi:hypothetical protein